DGQNGGGGGGSSGGIAAGARPRSAHLDSTGRAALATTIALPAIRSMSNAAARSASKGLLSRVAGALGRALLVAGRGPTALFLAAEIFLHTAPYDPHHPSALYDPRVGPPTHQSEA